MVSLLPQGKSQRTGSELNPAYPHHSHHTATLAS